MPPKPTRTRPRLLVDLSEKVSEDLRIDTPTPNLTAGPTMSAGPALRRGAQMSAVKVHAPAMAQATAAGSVRTGRPTVFKPPAELVARVKAKVRKVLPEDGEVIFTLTTEAWVRVDQIWVNEFDTPFWIAAEHNLDRVIDEWMASEFEAIGESFYEYDVDFSYGPNGCTLAPTHDQLDMAWDDVARGNECAYLVELYDASGDFQELLRVSAQTLMDFFGLDESCIYPTVIVADEVLAEDMAAIWRDDEVYLEGYRVRSIETEGQITTIHIVPTQ